MQHTLRTDLGGTPATEGGEAILSLLHLTDAHVIDPVSPARCEWVELLADDPLWKPLLHMHRPYEALTHWALAAHVERLHAQPWAPHSRRAYDLAVCTGDNIDNAQANELDAFVAILGGGRARMVAYGGVHDPSAGAGELGGGPWPFWCPQANVPDLWKPRGYPVVEDFLARASAELHSAGLGFAWASLPGNHDYLRQGTAWTTAALEHIATGANKTLRRPTGFEPADPQSLYVSEPHLFSLGATRQVRPDARRRAITARDWLEAHRNAGAVGFAQHHIDSGCADTWIDTEHVRVILLDTNHPGGNYEGSVGAAQLQWLDACLTEVDASGRIAVLCSHHGSESLTNTRGDDPERLLTAALLEVLHRHQSLVAWLVGHRHVHRVTPHPRRDGANSGFWEITTASIIDWPAQVRSVEILRQRDGNLEIVCTLLDHEAPDGSLAALHRDMSLRFAGERAQSMQGAAADGNVLLLRPRT